MEPSPEEIGVNRVYSDTQTVILFTGLYTTISERSTSMPRPGEGMQSYERVGLVAFAAGWWVRRADPLPDRRRSACESYCNKGDHASLEARFIALLRLRRL